MIRRLERLRGWASNERGDWAIQWAGVTLVVLTLVVGSWAYIEKEGRGPIGAIASAYMQQQIDCWDPDKECPWVVEYAEGKLDIGPSEPCPYLVCEAAPLQPPQTAPPKPWDPLITWLEPLWKGLEELEGRYESLPDWAKMASPALVGGLGLLGLVYARLGLAKPRPPLPVLIAIGVLLTAAILVTEAGLVAGEIALAGASIGFPPVVVGEVILIALGLFLLDLEVAYWVYVYRVATTPPSEDVGLDLTPFDWGLSGNG